MFHWYAAFILVSNVQAVGPQCEGGPKDGLFPSNPLDYGTVRECYRYTLPVGFCMWS